MEEVQKPSLFVVSDTYMLKKEGGVPFEEEMLQWVFFSELPESRRDKRDIIIYRNALSALMMLRPYTIRIVMLVDHERKELSFAKRFWGDIYENNTKVLTFSHDTRKPYAPFHTVLDWTQLHQVHLTGKAQEEDYDKVRNKLLLWSVDDWLKFFSRRIRDQKGIPQRWRKNKKIQR